jgi:oligosaccharide translocation protein RFT1
VYFDPQSKSSLKSFSVLSFLKLILQEFERIVLIIMDISHVSSIYSLISNLGSVIVRYLFSPLNEIIYNYFSRGDAKESVLALVTFIKFILVFSIMVISFGYNYSEIFLIFLYGEKWVTEESIAAMRTYMALIIFLGFNGVIEAFLFARGKESITKYNYLSIATTAIYLAATIGFLQMGLGAAGLFLGNIVNMSLRIIVCWYIEICQHISFAELLRNVMPTMYFLVTSVGLFFASHKHYGFAQTAFSHNILNFGLGVALFCFNLLPVVYEYRAVITKEVKSRLFKQQLVK